MKSQNKATEGDTIGMKHNFGFPSFLELLAPLPEPNYLSIPTIGVYGELTTPGGGRFGHDLKLRRVSKNGLNVYSDIRLNAPALVLPHPSVFYF